ncbi:hypothetical protein [Mycobacterium sp.]|nr:hypothetical protein [Mycobacterium sp.]HKP43041.1 hypothetical protein [Mycobacterium sp.]
MESIDTAADSDVEVPGFAKASHLETMSGPRVDAHSGIPVFHI